MFGIDDWLKARAQDKAHKEAARNYNQYLGQLGANRTGVQNEMANRGISFFDPSTSSQMGGSAGTSAMQGYRNEDQSTQQRYVAHDPRRDKLLLSLLEANVGRPGVAQSGELQRALGRTNRAFEGVEAAERNAAARRGQPSGVNYADRQRIAALQGEFGAQMDREQERRRFDQNALNQALMQRAGQDTNSQLRARYGQNTQDSRTYNQATSSFDPGAAAMNALNFQNAGLAPRANLNSGMSPFGNAITGLGGTALQMALMGMGPFGGGGGAAGGGVPWAGPSGYGYGVGAGGV